ncbi:recombinase family protein [Paenibacillus xerothermodurans]|uniref:Recombinase family protein n=1 Tax=Paenibacillus xerothermodurans TaxID=1977292 RepID=A0A2W1N5X3_PAEXE|nr:recombinase family protein [Paenibacillus xerothermodurans]PZE19030.1 recombinase family protein [Paenibacillus xerothermodurans]
MAKIGYARVSTADQSMDLQIDALNAAGCERIFGEKVSGKKNDRSELMRCLDYLRPGDTLVIWKLDRLGRTTKQLIELSHNLREREISLQIITLGVDTSNPAGKLFFAIMAGLAEMEAETIRERTKAGLEAARARGRNGGRPRLEQGKIDMALTLYDSRKYTISEITARTGVSKAKLYQVLKQRRND